MKILINYKNNKQIFRTKAKIISNRSRVQLNPIKFFKSKLIFFLKIKLKIKKE